MVIGNVANAILHKRGMISNSTFPVWDHFSDSWADSTPRGGVALRRHAAPQSGGFRDLPPGVVRQQGCTDEQVMLALCLLSILGSECADDLDRMEAVDGLCRLVGRHEARIPGESHRSRKRRHRKGRKRTCRARSWTG